MDYLFYTLHLRVPIIEFGWKYWVDIFGNVKVMTGKNKNNYLKSRIDRAGYLTIRLSKNGGTYTKYVHRLVAQCFIKRESKRPYVNHKNGIKINNNIQNLEWVTHSENIIHAYKNSLIKYKGKPVIDNCCNSEFNSIKKASLSYGMNYSTLRNYLNGSRSNPTCLQYKIS